VVKIDLEKAYDRLEWSFIREVLLFFNFPSHPVRLIMDCVSSSTISILFNGGRMEEFSPSRGIRQADPLSPYLFILCMEYLSLRIFEACQNKNWKSIKLLGVALPFPISFSPMISYFLRMLREEL
jgi:hypothetical protein